MSRASQGTISRYAIHLGGNLCVSNVLLGFMMVFFCSVLCSNAQGSIGDFISIDCGSAANYTDALGIIWSTDSGYASTGQNAFIDTSAANLGTDQSQDRQKLSTLRYFPGVRKKHCYVIPEAVENALYLIRAIFLGVNFTSGQNVSFGLSVNNFYWANIIIADNLTPLVEETTFNIEAGPLSICLLQRVGIPFISSLELRQLPTTAYQTTAAPSFAFKTLFRWNCGTAPTSPSLRYPSDPSDRLWSPDPPSLRFTRSSNFSATLNNTLLESAIPTTVLQSAWTVPGRNSLSFTWPIPAGSSILFFFMYFAEIFPASRNDQRDLQLYVDDTLIADIDVTSATSQVFNFTLALFETINVTIVPTSSSNRSAIVNAIEVFSVALYNNTYTTWQPDIVALSAIQQKLNLTDWTGDPCLPIPWDWLLCSLPNDTTISRVAQLNLSNYHLTETIPQEIQQLTELRNLFLDNNSFTGVLTDIQFPPMLEIIRLQNNRLEGPIPTSFATLTNLVVLNLDNNNLSGEVPEPLLRKVREEALTFSAVGNPNLCLDGSTCLSPGPSPQSNSSNSSTNSKSNSSIGIIIGAIAAAVVMLLLLAVLLFYLCKRRKSAPTSNQASGPAGRTPLGALIQDRHVEKSFSLMEVMAATDNFAKTLGSGGFGLVYYGKLPNGREVAVKVNKATDENGQRTAEFLNEVELLSRVHHRNLVSLVGYCDEPGQQILIYEYMSQGTLQEHLCGESQLGIILEWKTRLDISLNAARGLDYLHNSCYPPIIHRDVKSNNILLTDKLLAKVADFGISKITTEDLRTRGVTTQIKGTHGYLDPEYFMEQRLTTKSDVYSFGVVLLEIVTGRKPSETKFPNTSAWNIQDWVRQSVRDGNIHAIIDSSLGRNYNVESIWKVVETALLCLHREGVRRPDMKQVVGALTEALELQVRYTPTPVTYHSPSHLSPAEFDSYQPLHNTARTSRASAGSSNESVATYSWGSNVTAR